MLFATDLTITRSHAILLENGNLRLQKGELIVLTGPNGTGKTSLLRALAGLLPLESGAISRTGTQHFISAAPLPADIDTPEANLKQHAALAGERYALPHDPFGITPHLHTPLHRLSTGWRQRVKLTRLCLFPRDIWLLDEPTAGLDAHATDTLLYLLKMHRANGGAAMIATHQGNIWPEGALTLHLKGAA